MKVKNLIYLDFIKFPDYSPTSSLSPSKKSFKMKKGNYLISFSERIQNFKSDIMNKIGKEKFQQV